MSKQGEREPTPEQIRKWRQGVAEMRKKLFGAKKFESVRIKALMER